MSATPLIWWPGLWIGKTVPWCEWRAGKPLTQRQLARLLEPFGISPKQIWKGRNLRGYEKGQFSDAFTRYLGLCGESIR